MKESLGIRQKHISFTAVQKRGWFLNDQGLRSLFFIWTPVSSCFEVSYLFSTEWVDFLHNVGHPKPGITAPVPFAILSASEPKFHIFETNRSTHLDMSSSPHWCVLIKPKNAGREKNHKELIILIVAFLNSVLGQEKNVYLRETISRASFAG